MTKNDLILYMSTLLNLDTTPTYIYMDISEDLDSVQDYIGFKKEFKELYSSLKSQLQYQNAFQKYNTIMEVYKKKKTAFVYEDIVKIDSSSTKLFGKMTDICEYIRLHEVPSLQKIRNIDFKNILNHDKTNYFTENEQKILDLIGNSEEIYRLSTQSKQILQNKINSIMTNRTKEIKTARLQLGHNKINIKMIENANNV